MRDWDLKLCMMIVMYLCYNCVNSCENRKRSCGKISGDLAWNDPCVLIEKLPEFVGTSAYIYVLQPYGRQMCQQFRGRFGINASSQFKPFTCNITYFTQDSDARGNGVSIETRTRGRQTVPSGYLPRQPHICDTGFLRSDVITCRNDGTWKTDVCIPATSCGVIKQHQPNSEDGEYWLRLPNFRNYLTRIFCLGMTTSSPQEFLTLKNTNYGIYPMVMNENCTDETPLLKACSGQGGEIWFSKISVNITTMQVNQTDLTFANYSHNPKHLGYGNAHDCYTLHPNNDIKCGVKGFFRIDLSGTGWKVRETQQWETYGWKPIILSIEQQHDSRYIELKCGGFGGGCRPVTALFLDPFQGDGPNIQ